MEYEESDDELDPGELPEDLAGWCRYGSWTYITFKHGRSFHVVRLDDEEALSGVPAQLVASGGRRAALAGLHRAIGDDPDLWYAVERPDGSSFLVVQETMYAIAVMEDGQYVVLELTDYDHFEGELAKVVFKTDQYDVARREFSYLTAQRRAGRPPVAGRLSKASRTGAGRPVPANRRAGEAAISERCSRCGARILVGTVHDCR
jgi:hypothetical protein